MYKVLETEEMEWLSCTERPVGLARDRTAGNENGKISRGQSFHNH